MLRGVVYLVVLMLCGFTVNAAAQSGEARGVNPADNITKFELLPKLSVIDDATGVSVTTFTLKYDRAIRGTYGINVELPWLDSKAPPSRATGLAT